MKLAVIVNSKMNGDQRLWNLLTVEELSAHATEIIPDDSDADIE